MLVPVDPTLQDFTTYVESILQAMLDEPWFDPYPDSLMWFDVTRAISCKYNDLPIFYDLMNATKGIVDNWVAANVPSLGGID